MKPKEKLDSAKTIAVHCAHDAMVLLSELKPNPRNPNNHPANQIRLLARIIEAQGWRAPITVSRRSGLIVRGHGRLEAALSAGMESAPVDYQDYDSDEQELQDLIADNRIAELAEIDNSMLSKLLADLGDVDLTCFSTEYADQLHNTVASQQANSALPDGFTLPSGDIQERDTFERVTYYVASDRVTEFVSMIRNTIIPEIGEVAVRHVK